MKHTLTAIELKSGSKGLLLDIPGSTVVNMEFTFLSGYDFVEREKYEVPHSMEHLILGANDYFKSAQMFSRELSLNGAYHNAYTNSLLNGYVAEAPEFEWERVMELFWQGLTSPKFLPKEFKTEQETVMEELYSKLESHGLILDVALVKSMGNDHLLDYQSRIEALSLIKPLDLETHHQHTHNAQNMRFIVAGNIRGNRAELLQLLEKYTARLPQGDRKIIPDAKLIKPLGPISLKRETDKVHFNLKTAFYGELNERELMALGMLSYLLTGAWDSRIFGKGRTKGLLYHIVSNGGSSSGVSGFTINGSVVPAKASKLFSFISDELVRLKSKGFSINELKRAKQYMLGAFQIGHQTTQSLVDWYARFFTHDEYFEFESRPDVIKSITRRDIDRLVERFFGDSYWGVGVTGKQPDNVANNLHTEAKKVWG